MNTNAGGASADTGTPLPGWGWALVTIFVAFVALQLSNFGFTPLLAPIQKEFSMSFTLVGLFTGINGLIGIVMSIPAGLLLKRYGEKPLIVTGMVVIIVGFAVLATASSAGMALTGRVIWQVAFMALSPALFGSIALNAPKKWQAMFMGITSSVGAFAAMVGARLSGSLAHSYGWRGGFWGFAVILLVGLLVFASVYRWNKGKEVEPPIVDPNAPKPRSALKTPVVWWLALLFFLASVPSTAVIFMGAPVLATGFKLSVQQVSSIISLGFLLAIFVSYGIGWAADRTSRRLMLGAVELVLLVVALLMAGHSLEVARAAMVIGLAVTLSVPALVYANAGMVLEGREVGPIMGVVAVGMSFGLYFGPQILGAAKDLTGSFAGGWYAAAIIAFLAIIEITLLEVAARKSAAAR